MKKQEEKRLRLAVSRSNKYISAQIVDDEKRITLVGVSEKDLEKNKEKTAKSARAALVGGILAAKALKKGVKKIRFDRRRYRYHGRIKALAEAARKGGLDF
ncbi:50S ribosomal protein L18 [Patescibacteria group bacterium]|nr:50S ribosomal protein L18 [Patescibacteria group bacterium]